MGWGWGGQGGCELRSEAFVKIQKKIFIGGVGSGGEGGFRFGAQGGCEWRSEVFVKIQKKKLAGGGVRSGGGGGWVRGVRVDVNGEVKLL